MTSKLPRVYKPKLRHRGSIHGRGRDFNIGNGINHAVARTQLRKNSTDIPGEDRTPRVTTSDDTDDINAQALSHLDEVNRVNDKLRFEIELLQGVANKAMVPPSQTATLIFNSLPHILLASFKLAIWRPPLHAVLYIELHYVLAGLTLVFALLRYNRVSAVHVGAIDNKPSRLLKPLSVLATSVVLSGVLFACTWALTITARPYTQSTIAYVFVLVVAYAEVLLVVLSFVLFHIY